MPGAPATTEKAKPDMTETYEIAVFEGDGIGPEITTPTIALLKQLAAASTGYDLRFVTLPAGAGHYARTGESLPAESLRVAAAADAILLFWRQRRPFALGRHPLRIIPLVIVRADHQAEVTERWELDEHGSPAPHRRVPSRCIGRHPVLSL